MKINKIKNIETITLNALLAIVLIVFTSCSSSKTYSNNGNTDYIQPKGMSENNPYKTRYHSNNLNDLQNELNQDSTLKNTKPLRRTGN